MAPSTDEHRPGAPSGWHTPAEALRLVVSPVLLRRTLLTALIVGTILSLVNQSEALSAGDVSASTWLRVGANYCIPFLVSSIGALSATRT